MCDLQIPKFYNYMEGSRLNQASVVNTVSNFALISDCLNKLWYLTQQMNDLTRLWVFLKLETNCTLECSLVNSGYFNIELLSVSYTKANNLYCSFFNTDFKFALKAQLFLSFSFPETSILLFQN